MDYLCSRKDHSLNKAYPLSFILALTDRVPLLITNLIAKRGVGCNSQLLNWTDEDYGDPASHIELPYLFITPFHANTVKA